MKDTTPYKYSIEKVFKYFTTLPKNEQEEFKELVSDIAIEYFTLNCLKYKLSPTFDKEHIKRFCLMYNADKKFDNDILADAVIDFMMKIRDKIINSKTMDKKKVIIRDKVSMMPIRQKKRNITFLKENEFIFTIDIETFHPSIEEEKEAIKIINKLKQKYKLEKDEIISLIDKVSITPNKEIKNEIKNLRKMMKENIKVDTFVRDYLNNRVDKNTKILTIQICPVIYKDGILYNIEDATNNPLKYVFYVGNNIAKLEPSLNRDFKMLDFIISQSMKFLDKNLTNKKKKINLTFFAHNGGNYDYQLLFGSIIKRARVSFNNEFVYKDFKVKLKAREAGAFMLEIRNKKYKVVFLDTFRIFRCSLAELISTFCPELSKQEKPEGLGTKYIKEEEFLNDKEFQQYAAKDVIYYAATLHKILDTFYKNFGIPPRQCISSSKIGKLAIIANTLMNLNTQIPKIKELEELCLNEYSGGLTQAKILGYLPKVHIFDINSSYPKAMTLLRLLAKDSRLWEVVENCDIERYMKLHHNPERDLFISVEINGKLPFFIPFDHVKGVREGGCAEKRLEPHMFEKHEMVVSYYGINVLYKIWKLVNSKRNDLPKDCYLDIKVKKIIRTSHRNYELEKEIKEKIETIFKQRAIAKKQGDKIINETLKLILNGCYGTFGMTIESLLSNIVKYTPSTSYYIAHLITEIARWRLIEMNVDLIEKYGYPTIDGKPIEEGTIISSPEKIKGIMPIYYDTDSIIITDTEEARKAMEEIKKKSVDENGLPILGELKYEETSPIFILKEKRYITDKHLKLHGTRGVSPKHIDNELIKTLRKMYEGKIPKEVIETLEINYCVERMVKSKEALRRHLPEFSIIKEDLVLKLGDEPKFEFKIEDLKQAFSNKQAIVGKACRIKRSINDKCFVDETYNEEIIKTLRQLPEVEDEERLIEECLRNENLMKIIPFLNTHQLGILKNYLLEFDNSGLPETVLLKLILTYDLPFTQNLLKAFDLSFKELPSGPPNINIQINT